jgi:serine/threonine-protein kinase
MDDPRILELLAEWEEQRQQGRSLSAEQLCPDDAALQKVLRQRIRKRQRLQAVLDLPGETLALEPPPAPSVPTIAGYEILEVLGRGGMGVVYKARQTALNRLVAIKMVLAGGHAGSHELERLRTEAKACARLGHPNIVQIYAVDDHAGFPYLVLELVEGSNLAQSVGGQPLPARRAAELVQTLALAVEDAHKQNIVHRDLKPSNVLVAADGTLKIADFGLAKLLDVQSDKTGTAAVLGSPSYMAPEQAEGGSRAVGPATDVYALGAILYELLTSQPPFVGETLLETLEQVRQMDPAPPRQLQPKLPRDLEAICLKCLEKKPAHRYASAADLAADLRSFLDGEPIQARSTTTWSPTALLDQMVRTIGHIGFDVNFRSWSSLLLALIPVPLTAHILAFVLLRDQPYYYYAMPLVSAVVVVTLTSTIFLGNQQSMRRVPSRQRRHLRSVWAGHVASFMLVPLTVWWLAPPREPADFFIVYPLWLAIGGLTFMALASEAGTFYVISACCYSMAALMLLQPEWSPFVVALLITANMLMQGLMLRRLGRS